MMERYIAGQGIGNDYVFITCIRRKKKYVSMHKNEGYTLIDTLLQLTILIVCMTLFLSFYPMLYRTQTYIVPETLEWERFVKRLTAELAPYEIVEATNDKTIGYRHLKWDQQYVSFRKNNISLTGAGSKAGNIVILTRVKMWRYVIKEDELYIEVQFERTGTTHSATIPLPNYQ